MKKILLFLFAVISVQAFGQITETRTFDFTNPGSLNPSVSMPQGTNEKNVYYTTFTNGPVTIKFVDYGQGVMLNRSAIDNTCTLCLRQRASMEISVSGSSYALTSVFMTGSVGTIKEISSSTKSWYAPDQSTKSKEFHNGTEETFIQKITVTYTRAAQQVKFVGVNFDTSEPISSFKSAALEFDQEISSITSQSVKLYQLSGQGGKRIDGFVNDLEASISTTNPKKVIASLKNDAEINADGFFELFVPAGAFKSVENSSSLEISVPFEIFADRAVFNYVTVSPDPKDGPFPKFPEQIILTYPQNASVTGDAAMLYSPSNPSKVYSLPMESDGHQVILTYDDEALPDGNYILEIEEGSINNGFRPSQAKYQCNPKIQIIYTIQDEVKTWLERAKALLEEGGLDKAKLGYPADDSKGRKALVDAVAKGTDCTADELKDAISAYQEESDVRLPENDKWYTIAAVNTEGGKLYLRYSGGKLGLTEKAADASSFKALKNEQTLSFKTPDDKFLFVRTGEDIDGASLNLVAESGIYGLTVARLDFDGEQHGLLTLKGNDYAVVAFGTGKLTAAIGSTVHFEKFLSSGFAFAESSAEQNMVLPAVAFLENTITRPNTNLLLTVTNVDNAVLAENAAPYFTLNGVKVDFEDIILTKNPNHHTQFYVNTAGLKAGEYTLVLPKGTFICMKDGEQTADIELSKPFKIISAGGDQSTGFIEDFGFICYQTLSRGNVSCIRGKDLEELYLFTYGDEEYGGIYADPTKPVYIVQAYTDAVLATGHFEPYPEFSEDTGFATGVMAIKLVMDEPLEEDALRSAKGDYGYKIPAGTFGDKNFKLYIEGDPSINKSDCHVNKLSYNIVFYVDDREATQNYPSSGVLTEARQLLRNTGIGYPVDDCASRLTLKNKVGYIQGSDEEYQSYINDFYNEEKVEKPEADKYYRVYAYAVDEETEEEMKAYLSYEGGYVGVTSEPSQATGFKMVVNEDGTYRFMTGNGMYLRLLSNELSNVTDYYQSEVNDITLQKLKIDGVEAKKTFGLFSMKMEGVYAYLDVINAKILVAGASLSDFSPEKSCAFMFEEIDKASIPTPKIETLITPTPGTKVESLDVVKITFIGVGDLKLAEPKKIIMRTTEKEFPLQGYEIKGNSAFLDFGSLPTGSYTLYVGEGAFTYTFADMPHETAMILEGFDVIPTGITTIYVDGTDEPLYDLQGRMVTGTLKSGVYIKNGKKVYIK